MKILRTYDDYTKYINHQKEKTLDPERRKKLQTTDWLTKIATFTNVFQPYKKKIEKSKDALCICARTGQEVVALQNMGVENVIGVDLVACPPYVQEADAHALPFPDNSFDFVFSNSFDHSIHPDKFVREAERVTRVGGWCCLHLWLCQKVDPYAENILSNADSVISLFTKSSVKISTNIVKTKPYGHYDWQLVMKKTS